MELTYITSKQQIYLFKEDYLTFEQDNHFYMKGVFYVTRTTETYNAKSKNIIFL